MFSNCINTKQQGNVGIASAILHFSMRGMTVCLPLNDSQDFDLVVDTTDGLKKIQVKTVSYKPVNNFSVCLKSSGGTAGKIYHTVAEGSCDYLFICTADGDNYLIPKEVFSKYKSSLVLTAAFDIYKV